MIYQTGCKEIEKYFKYQSAQVNLNVFYKFIKLLFKNFL